MAKNSLKDLNNHLFAQMERLGDEDITQEDLKKEVERAKAINGIAKNIIDNTRIAMDGVKLAYETLPGNEKGNLPEQFNWMFPDRMLKSTNE